MNALWYFYGIRGVHETWTSVMGKTRLLTLQMLVLTPAIQWDLGVDLHSSSWLSTCGKYQILETTLRLSTQAWEQI